MCHQLCDRHCSTAMSWNSVSHIEDWRHSTNDCKVVISKSIGFCLDLRLSAMVLGVNYLLIGLSSCTQENFPYTRAVSSYEWRKPGSARGKQQILFKKRSSYRCQKDDINHTLQPLIYQCIQMPYLFKS